MRTPILLTLLILLAPRSGAQTWEACGSLYTVPGEAFGDLYGILVRNVHDVDLDGIDDFVACSPNSSAGGPGAGRVYLQSGATGQVIHTWTGTPGERFGNSANGVGDLDADGTPDILVGAPDFTNATAGKAYVFSGLDGSLLHTLLGENPGDRFGQTVNGLGDVDGDGIGDFACGSENHSSQGPGRGRAYIYSGATATLLRTHDGTSDGAQLGSAMGPVGDRDGDGHDDYILGADEGASGAGKAFLIDGQTGNVLCPLSSPAGGANFGSFMMGRSIGDLDGDTVTDFFVTDFANSNSRGSIFVYDGATCALRYELTGESAGDTFGTGGGRAGDMDGDGLPDLVFGALGGSTAGRGQVRFFRGLDGAPLGTLTGDTAGAGFGYSPCGSIDIDGDTRPDLIVGLPTPNNSTGVLYALSSQPLPPTATCAGLPNSTGVGATLDYLRSLSLALNEFRLRARSVPAGENGLFFYGATDTQLPFGDGQLCVGAPLFRAAAPVTADSTGKATLDLDFTAAPFATGPGAALPGGTWTFQFWYRDSAGVTGTNLSNGLRLSWCP